MKAHNLPRSGFTLVELLVVIAIVGILAALSLASLKGMLEEGTTAKCSSNMKQVAAAALLFAAENNGNLPKLNVANFYAAAIVTPYPRPASQRITSNPNAYWWQDLLLQYASDSKIYSCPKLTLPATQAIGGGQSINCPLGIGMNNILDVGLNSDLSPIWLRLVQVPQPSLTVWFTDAGLNENGTEPRGPWSERKDAPRTGMSYVRGASNDCVMPRHKGRINVAFADGHVATVTPDQINWGGNSTTTNGTNYIGFTRFR
jgi:general secretion pathway protein G